MNRVDKGLFSLLHSRRSGKQVLRTDLHPSRVGETELSDAIHTDFKHPPFTSRKGGIQPNLLLLSFFAFVLFACFFILQRLPLVLGKNSKILDLHGTIKILRKIFVLFQDSWKS